MSPSSSLQRVSFKWVALLGVMSLAGGLGLTGVCPFSATPVSPGNSGVTGKFVGAERCSQCHMNTHSAWSGTLHAKALETLEAIGQGTNAACLVCHTVGFGEPGGFVSRELTNALAGVQCENCHGPGADHVNNVNDESLRPPHSIAASVCGQCHTGEHHPNFEQWSESHHALVEEHNAENFTNGILLNSCGTCHSGDFRYMAILEGETVSDDFLAGKTREEMNAITCAICHNPHARTQNAPFADEGRDYQLRFREVANPVASNSEEATNPNRFNICGQCHHSRGRDWTSTSRGPHQSLQANIYTGEMPMPEGQAPLVLSINSPHALVQEQCATCHMFRKDFESEVAPAISGHSFEVNFEGCVASGCHPSAENAEARKLTLENTIKAQLDMIKSRLQAYALATFTEADDWDYSCCGGVDSSTQATIPDTIKKARFLYYYALNDGSYGTHNPDYVKALLTEAEDQLTLAGF